jgi:hypothetical protein
MVCRACAVVGVLLRLGLICTTFCTVTVTHPDGLKLLPEIRIPFESWRIFSLAYAIPVIISIANPVAERTVSLEGSIDMILCRTEVRAGTETTFRSDSIARLSKAFKYFTFVIEYQAVKFPSFHTCIMCCVSIKLLTLFIAILFPNVQI